MRLAIIYTVGNYTVRTQPKGYAVYREGMVAERCDIIGYPGHRGLSMAIAKADARAAKEPAVVAHLRQDFSGAYHVEINRKTVAFSLSLTQAQDMATREGWELR